MTNRNTNYNEEGTVAAKLNRAKRTAKLMEIVTEEAFQRYKQQFDKDIQNRRFFPDCTVYVYTTQRGKSHRKLFRPYKGLFKCIGFGKNGNLILEPMKGGKTLSVHKNNCKMAPFREQFYDLITENEPTPQRISSRRVPNAKLFKYSAFDNPNILNFEANQPRQDDPDDRGDDDLMDESEDPEVNQPESPNPYPDLDYRERDRFPE